MTKKVILSSMLMLALAAGTAFPQQLDGRPFTPGVDTDINLFMGSWQDSEPREIHGNLMERDILTRGNPANPPAKGAVLQYTNRYTYATVAPGKSTKPAALKNEQEVLFIASGTGTISAGNQKEKLFRGICVLIPEGLKYTISNTGNDELGMYLICEPVPDGFTPVEKLVVKNENTLPIASTTGHWTHIVKNLLHKEDGLATLYAVLTVGHDPMTIGHPHSHNPGCEEVWTAFSGTSIAFLGKQILWQPPGTAYNIPPDSKTPHANINVGDGPIKLLYFSVRKDIDGTGL